VCEKNQAVAFAQLAEGLDHSSAHQAELTDVGLDLVVGQGAHDSVESPGRDPLEKRLLLSA
jgi:hypothetical protein